MSSNLIPYIIIEARSTSYLPSISYIKGFMEEYRVKNYLFKLLIQFIQEQTSFANIDTIEKVNKFWNYFYSGVCMKNKPWEAFIVKNGIWESIIFTNEEILYALLNKKEYIEGDEMIESDEIIEDDPDINYYISSDEDN
jgi:hypothetical protein